MKMCSFVWLLCIITLWTMEVQTAILDNIKHTEPRRCHHCLSNKTRACEAAALPSVLCPAEEPYCATIAFVPNFTYSLSCTAGGNTPCLLSNKGDRTFQITCICTGHFCNSPYTAQLRTELLNFLTKFPNNTSSELTDIFFNSSVFANVSKPDLYKTITVKETLLTENTNIDTQPPILKPRKASIGPRAEALKNPATVPPDDDEDDGEGSGLEDKTQLPAAPAAPSSFLPSEQNSASPNFKDITLLVVLLCLSLILNKNW